MKIRSDFVTNSSSSSFVLTLMLEYDNETISKNLYSDDGEGAYRYVDLVARKSPKQLAQAKDNEELIEMLNESVVQDGIFSYGKSVKLGTKLAKKINEKSIKDLKSISIIGDEENYDSYIRNYKFNIETGEYTLHQYGEEMEINGGSGGDIRFDDEEELTRSDYNGGGIEDED